MVDPVAENQALLRSLLEKGAISQEEYARLSQSTPSVSAGNTETIAVAQGAQATAASDHSLAIGGNVQGDVYVGVAPKDGKEALAIYCVVLAYTTGRLSLRGLDRGASDASRKQAPLDLAQVYVDLDTTSRAQIISFDSKSARNESDQPPLSAMEAVIRNRRLVLLGDPGSGKSTFVNRLAGGLALAPTATTNLTGWPASEANLLPVLVILRDYARTMADGEPDCRHLWSFIKVRLDAQNLGAASEPIHQCLEDGRALVMFDGLDEISTRQQRCFVRDAVTAFTERYPRNRFLLTCRILSYQEPVERDEEDLRINGFPVYTLAPFDDARIDRFIAAWYGELTQQGTVRSEDRDDLTARLQQAVRRPDLHGMAGNPLLLTVMALVHTHKGRLPDARAILYEDTVDLLLSRWEEQKLAKDNRPGLSGLLTQAGRAEIDLKRVLWSLAYASHGQGEGGDGALADIPEVSLQKALANLKKNAEGQADLNWARDLMETMKLRAGLLIERLPGVFTFPHRTLQEYLACVHLTSEGDFVQRVMPLTDDIPRWREVILLAVGYLLHRHGDISRPLALGNELCPIRLQDVEPAWRQAWLAGEVLAELGSRTADRQTGQELLVRVCDRLQALVSLAKLPAKERGFVGDLLARLGDPRPEVTEVDRMQFCWIPEGIFLMGSDDQDKLAYSNEKPQHECAIPYGYWLAHFPVTVAQFRYYLEQTGTQPGYKRCLNGPSNHPVVYVSWHEAIAFCQWLTGRWQSQGFLPDGWVVTLPSEAEWEKAARGGLEIPVKPLIQSLSSIVGRQPLAAMSSPGFSRHGDTDLPMIPLQANDRPSRIYPWGGGEADPERMNFYGTGILRTSAVGSFPHGATPYGNEEMSGNVWEWTRSVYEGYPYPEQGEKRQMRENLDAKGTRVLRGGAFFISQDYVRCASRFNLDPDYRNYYAGFRIVVSPFL